MDVQSLQLIGFPPIPHLGLRRRHDADTPPPAPRSPVAPPPPSHVDPGAPARLYGRLDRPRPRRARVDDPDRPAPRRDRPGARGHQPGRPGGRPAPVDRVRAHRIAPGPADPRQLGSLDLPLPVHRRRDGARRPDGGRLGGLPRDPRAPRARVAAVVRDARQPLGHGAGRRRRRPDRARRPRCAGDRRRRPGHGRRDRHRRRHDRARGHGQRDGGRDDHPARAARPDGARRHPVPIVRTGDARRDRAGVDVHGRLHGGRLVGAGRAGHRGAPRLARRRASRASTP